MTPSFRSSRAPECVLPRAHRDASQRLQNYGPVQSMPEDEPDWFDLTTAAYCIAIFLVGIIFIYHGEF